MVTCAFPAFRCVKKFYFRALRSSLVFTASSVKQTSTFPMADTVASTGRHQQRLSASCEHCALVGLSCSQTRPTCSRCIAAGIECQYSSPSREPKSEDSAWDQLMGAMEAEMLENPESNLEQRCDFPSSAPPIRGIPRDKYLPYLGELTRELKFLSQGLQSSNWHTTATHFPQRLAPGFGRSTTGPPSLYAGTSSTSNSISSRSDSLFSSTSSRQSSAYSTQALPTNWHDDWHVSDEPLHPSFCNAITEEPKGVDIYLPANVPRIPNNPPTNWQIPSSVPDGKARPCEWAEADEHQDSPFSQTPPSANSTPQTEDGLGLKRASIIGGALLHFRGKIKELFALARGYQRRAGVSSEQGQCSKSSLAAANGAGSAAQASRKRKMSDRDLNDDENEDSDADRTSAKRPANKETKPDAVAYACPYFKHNPALYKSARNCPGPGWPSVRRVKWVITICSHFLRV